MEPNKLEQDFKRKLDQRTIQPTEMAWDRLDAMLSVAEKKSKKQRPTWMFAAAGVVLFLLVGALFFYLEGNKAGTVIKGSEVVTAPESQAPKAQEKETTGYKTDIVPEAEIQVGKEEVVYNDKGASLKKSKEANEVPTNNTLNQTEIITVPTQQAVTQTDNVEVINKPVKIKNNITVDADKLLASVENGTKTPIAKSNKKAMQVNAGTLLASVESELDEGFKDKALQSAVKNFQAIKSSLANRNYQ